MIKCWNCHTELDEPLSSARKTEKHGQHIDTSPPWWDGNIAIPFSTDEWEHVLNGLSALLENAYVWEWATIEFETDIRNMIDRIEKNIGQE
jgi:hypothetical protein